MRRILLIAAAAVAGLLGVALILPAFLPSEAYRGQIEREATGALGRETSVQGRISVSILPRIMVRAQEVRVANAPGFDGEPFAEMGALRLSVDLFPLLSGRVSVNELVLVDPVVRLSERGGRNNWTFAPAAGEPDAQAGAGGFARRPGALPFEASLGDVRLENGLIVYSDGAVTRRIESLDLAVEMTRFDAPARLRGDFSLEGEPVQFDVALASLRGFLEGARTDAEARIESAVLDAAFDGAFLESPDVEFAGRLELGLPDLQRLAALAGSPLPDGEIFRLFEAQGQVAGSPSRVAFSGAQLRFDDIEAEGDFTAELDRRRPLLTGSLSLETLDVTPYAASESARDGGAPAQPSGEGGEWSDEPVDLSVLRALDARLDLTAGRLIYGAIEASDAALTAVLEDGRLQADLTSFRLYDGAGTARLVADARSATPSYVMTARFDALQALPFLSAAAGFDRLSGLGGLSLDVTSQGASPRAIIEALNGQGRFQFADGAIRGINVARVIRGVQQALETGQLPAGFGQDQETDFSSLGGTIDITDGIASNPDLQLLSPLVRVLGEGRVNLAEQRIDYRLSPRAVADLTGQGGAPDLSGIAVPVRISGSLSQPQIGIDFEQIARDLVRARAGGLIGGQAGQALSDGARIEDVLRQEGSRALLDALGAGDDPQAEGEGEASAQEDPAGALLRGLLGAQRPQPAEEEEPPAEGAEEAGEGGGAPNR